MWKTGFSRQEQYPKMTDQPDDDNNMPTLDSDSLYPSAIMHQETQGQQYLSSSNTWNNGKSPNSVSLVSQYQRQRAKPPQFINPLLRTLEALGIKSPSQPSAAQVAYRLTKLINTRKKMVKREQDFFSSIANWMAILPNYENSRMLSEYNALLDIQIRSEEELIRKQENINLQLAHVFQRENKMEVQRNKRQATMIEVREEERKKGEGQALHLAKEKIEEIDASIEVINEQLIKAISTVLKGSLLDYAICLQTSCNRMKEGCDTLFRYVNEGSMYPVNKIYAETTRESGFEKIHPLTGSGSGSESRLSDDNKENKLKDRTNELNLLKSGKIRNASSKKVFEGAGDEATSGVEPTCLECLAVGKAGKVVHAAFCSHFKKPALERPVSSQSISMPGKISQRLSSLMRSKESSIWQ